MLYIFTGFLGAVSTQKLLKILFWPFADIFYVFRKIFRQKLYLSNQPSIQNSNSWNLSFQYFFIWLFALFMCGCPFLSTSGIGSYSMRATASYSFEGLVAEAIYHSHSTIFPQFNIVSDNCHPASCNLNSKKLFKVSDDWYCNPERGFEPRTEEFSLLEFDIAP